MLSYSGIIRQAYQITIKNPILWLFGLFVAGGFNLNFLQYQNVPARQLSQSLNWKDVLLFLQSHPGALATLSLSLLLFSLLGLVITNWCRVMLVLVVDKILKTKFPEVWEQAVNSKKSLWPVIKISVLTSLLIVLAGLALFLPPLLFGSHPQLQLILWVVAAVIFLPIIVAVSCINIFTTYFIILFKQKLPTSLTLGTDFFLAHWTQILGLAIIVGAIYLVGFFIGVSTIYILRQLFGLLFSANIWIPTAVANVLIWLLLGLLNAFINTALLLFFLQVITPVENEEKTIEKAVMASAAG